MTSFLTTILLVVSAFGTTLSAQIEMSGLVVDAKARLAVSNASISVDGNLADSTVSDSEGHFTIRFAPGVEKGRTFGIRVVKTDYEPYYKGDAVVSSTILTIGLIHKKTKPSSSSSKSSSHDQLQLRFHDALKSYGLPFDLYDRQHQLRSLTIDQGDLPDLDWLNSSTITKLTLASPRLASIAGLIRVTKLESLDINLIGAPLKSLNGLSSLHQLRTLVLRNTVRGPQGELRRAADQLVPQLADFPNLRTLYLDLERSDSPSVPDVGKCPELQNLILDLRSTTKISNLPNFSALSHLQSLTLFLDNSKVSSLQSLAGLNDLQNLTISLNGRQTELLSGLSDSPGPRFLKLILTSPLTKNQLPNLSSIHNLVGLTLHMPGPRGSDLLDTTQVPDITYLDKIQVLVLSVEDSEASALPDIGNLTALKILDLNLQGSKIEHLPVISKLNRLQQLSLNLAGTEIETLPNFAEMGAGLQKLNHLALLLAYSKVHSLEGIDHLKELRTLELDIRGSQIKDLASIAKLESLEKLVLWLRWSQIGDLPDLKTLKNLCSLELHIEESWPEEELPNAFPFAKLQTIGLILKKSAIRDLSLLRRAINLEKLCLDLHDTSSIDTLPDLTVLKNLTFVSADVRNSSINLAETQNLGKLQEIAIEKSFSSLDGLPQSVKALRISPLNQADDVSQCSKIGHDAPK